jgi:hypothetical protein
MDVKLYKPLCVCVCVCVCVCLFTGKYKEKDKTEGVKGFANFSSNRASLDEF